jgi:hypothetical protein
MTMVMDVANVSASPIVFWALERNLWLPFQLSALLWLMVSVLVLAIPATHALATQITEVEVLNSEEQPLLVSY